METIIKNIKILIIGVILGVGIFASSQWLKTANLTINGQDNKQTSNTPIETKTIIKEKSDIIEVVKKVKPSVVSIAIKRNKLSNPFEYDPFGFFYTPPQFRSQQPTESGIGTGFIVSTDGIIVTNKHVVNSQGKYIVVTHDNKKYDVEKITPDPFNDLALLKINATGLQAAILGDSDSIEVGQTAIAMGNALGEFSHTVTVGVVSGLNRQIEASDQLGNKVEKLNNVIQTDAAINPGNSGGPLLNIAGQVIGINTAISGSAQNIGFAIPINAAKPTINEFLTAGKISRPYIGVQYRMITKRLALINEIPEGAYIFSTIKGGPADKAGIKEEDIIIELAGQRLTEQNDLAAVIRKLKVGQTVEVKFFRDNNTQSTNITIGEFSE